MPDTAEIKDLLLDLLAKIEIDEHVELAINVWGEEGTELLRGIATGAIEADASQRANAAYLLGVLGAPKAADELAAILAKAKTASIRLSALDGIRHAGGATARTVLLKIASSGTSDTTERIYAVEWLGEIGEGEDGRALDKIDTEPEEVLLAQRIHDAVKAIEYRQGWEDLQQGDGENDGVGQDGPKNG